MKVNIGDKILEMNIIKTETMPAGDENYQLMQIETNRGEITCQYYDSKGASKGVIIVGGIGGGFDTPAKGLYPRLCEGLKEAGISSLRVRYRFPTDLTEATFDTVAGKNFLKSQGIGLIGLVGHSLGGAVVIQAAVNDQAVRTIVTLSTQGFGADRISQLKKGTSILLIHGKEDRILPTVSSAYVYRLAYEPKMLILYEGAGHTLDEVADEVYNEVKDWIIANLK